MIILDIEGHAIEDGAPLLPEPTGCAIKQPGKPGFYMSWGHPTNNNCTKEDFARVLKSIWNEEWVTHNGLGFDVEVLRHHFNMPPRDPMLTHDTMFLAYLHNPHARELGLKPLAEDWLGMAPEEQDELHDWIIRNTECRSKKQAGAYIWAAPGDLVGKYAVGDIDRTEDLFNYLRPVLEDMPEAYNRERRLAPILAEIQQRGVRCDLERLKEDYHKAMLKKALLEDLIRKHLRQGPSFNPGSDKELGAVLMELGYEGFLITPSGKPSMAKPSLEKVLQSDPELLSLLKSRSTYDTLTGTFMEPWIRYAEKNGGRIHACYNQVRNPDGFGTRTGRLSSSKPNFQNVPKDLGTDYFGDPFPSMRTYLLPEPGHVWICGDFKNQEPRLTAHYEAGRLMQEFITNPNLDPYMFVAELCKVIRHEAKQILLGLIYAMGAAALGERLGADAARATMLRNIVRAALPDVMELDRDCKERFMRGLPIRTLGGRDYYCEPPSNGRRWEYKALNTLIQGSAADQTKETIIYMHPRIVGVDGRLLGTVHDEVSSSAEERHVPYIEEMMQEAANHLPCDVPMVMDIAHGYNWAEAKP